MSETTCDTVLARGIDPGAALGAGKRAGQRRADDHHRAHVDLLRPDLAQRGGGHGFAETPDVPEPSSWLLCLIGCGVSLLASRLKKGRR
ncbi:MAG: PEP-CTERM sorting domain-containing protein [Isosphaeraceae bacterium]